MSDYSRRGFLVGAGALGASLLGSEAVAGGAPSAVELPFANGRRERVGGFPQKGAMVLQRSRPPLLETPFEVFDRGVFTPNDRFYVRWHLENVPTSVDPGTFTLAVRGAVREPLQLSLTQLERDFPKFEIVAVNQCAGNSRGLFNPRVPGAQWANGAMGNARWQGVRLKDVLDRAGVRAEAVEARFNGLDVGTLPQTPDFIKSLQIDHARDGEVMIAYAMNGERLPLLNGFPLRLVVPGWYATYWVKMLNDIEVIDHADDNFWMAKSYLIPDTPHANIVPGQTGVKMIPINRMVPRSFFTNASDGQTVPHNHAMPLRGIAFGGDSGVAKVLVSADDGQSWQEAKLGKDYGKYSFRQWDFVGRLQKAGPQKYLVRCVNTAGDTQPDASNWNGSGYMRNVVESLSVRVI